MSDSSLSVACLSVKTARNIEETLITTNENGFDMHDKKNTFQLNEFTNKPRFDTPQR